MMCLNFGALFSRNISGLHEQNQNKQGAMYLGSLDFTAERITRILPCLYFTLFYGAKFKHNMEATNSTRS